MKTNLGIAVVFALGASATGVGALNLVESESTHNLTNDIISHCAALPLGSLTGFPLGASMAELGLELGVAPGTQLIAPMSRALGAGACGVAAGSRSGAEGMAVALDAVSIVVNSSSATPGGIEYTGSTAGNPLNEWRNVLRLIYTGMDITVGNNVFARDCASSARKALVNNWDNVFLGTSTACTDSHPSVPGIGAAGYDPSNSIVEPGIRHAFRRDDGAGETQVFLSLLGLGGIDFAQSPPAGSTTQQAAVYRALANSPFCNVKRPDDDWPPVTLPAGPFHSSQIPEMTAVGVPAGAGPGLGWSSQLRGSANPKNLSPFLNEYMDQDPIRRRCVGRGNNASVGLPMEQVCGADGALGVVLPIRVPQGLTPAEAYPTLPCNPGLGFFFGPTATRPTTEPVRCPNGDASQDSKCLLPVRSDPTLPLDVAFDCINPPGNAPQVVFDEDGNGTEFLDAPLTDGRTDVDGRVYNQILRRPDGSILTESRPDPSRVGLMTTPVIGSFYRLHTTRSLLLPPLHASSTCTWDNSDDQLACLTFASPCSLSFAARGAVVRTGASSAQVNGVPASPSAIQALVSGGTLYPLAHRVYLNSIEGFDLLPVGSPQAELTKCFATLPFSGAIAVDSVSNGLVKLPGLRPFCDDFNGQALCTDALNADACVGNELLFGGVIPTSACDNGVRDGDETAVDVCPLVRPSCSAADHHCR